jgi:hypothetical protein
VPCRADYRLGLPRRIKPLDRLAAPGRPRIAPCLANGEDARVIRVAQSGSSTPVAWPTSMRWPSGSRT